MNADPLYPLIAFVCALVILIIISRTGNKTGNEDKVDKAFNHLTRYAVAFCLHDALWGFLALMPVVNRPALLISTSVYHILYAVLAYLWINYVLSYLGGRIKYKKLYVGLTHTAMAAVSVLVAVNAVNRAFFDVDSAGRYVYTDLRGIFFYLQLFIYGMAALLSLIQVFMASGEDKDKFESVFLFVMAPAFAGIYQLKYHTAPFSSIGCMIGCCIIYTSIVTKMNEERLLALNEAVNIKKEQRVKDIINVLSSECNSVYYCNGDTHEYEILFQNDFIKGQSDKMLAAYPRFEDAFKAFVASLVHHDYSQIMLDALEKIPARLAKDKSFKVEFLRKYGDRYLYTEMNCVKIGEPEDELHDFVVGFVENDREYRSGAEKQKQLEMILTERTAELHAKNRKLSKISEDIVGLLGALTEARDTDSGEHIRCVRGFTNIVARRVMQQWPEFGLTNDFVDMITSASALHDIGKIMIPDAILLKPGKLTPEEFEVMKTHCEKGCEILKKAPEDWSYNYLKLSLDICRYHHERIDGRGYPEGLKGNDIPISAQIVALADCFDALITDRKYKKAYSLGAAFQTILDGGCGAFSEKLLKSFSECREEIFLHAGNTKSVFTSSIPSGLSTERLSWTKLLFVDDNEMSRELGAEILMSEGAEVVLASSGEEAVRLFKNSEDGEFDAVLMDVIMPGMDGMEATRVIRSLPRRDAGTVAIIALTSLAAERDIERCLASGMNSFITKPISISTLTKVLIECMQPHVEALGDVLTRADMEASDTLDRAIAECPSFSGPASDYDILCYADCNKKDVPIIRCTPKFRKILDSISRRLPSNKRFDFFLRSLVSPKNMEEFINNTNKSKICLYLSEHVSYQIFVPLMTDGKESLYKMKIAADPGRKGCYIIAFKSVEDETRDEIRLNELIKILAESYMVVDFIDLKEDRYTKYRSTETILDEFGHSGSYTQLIKAYIDGYVYEKDRKRASDFFERKRVRQQLLAHKSIVMRFRDIRSGKPRFYEAHFVCADDSGDARYAIFTLSDINDKIKSGISLNGKLIETQKQLIEAERKANKDVLTGVKSVNLYADSMAELSEELKNKKQSEFALIVCDVNNLKGLNDSFGHDIGDMYIKNCCRIICDTFKKSPVYRKGGDEFVVLLKGYDYENREALFEQLYESIKKAEALPDADSGKASFEAGMAAYDSDKDSSVSDVFKRADKEMYRRKRLSKARQRTS